MFASGAMFLIGVLVDTYLLIKVCPLISLNVLFDRHHQQQQQQQQQQQAIFCLKIIIHRLSPPAN